MAGSSGDIRLRILAANKTNAAFKKARANIKGLSGALSGFRVAAAGAAVAGGLIGASIVKITREGARYADQIGKVSTRLGVSEEKLSAYAFAAERGNAEQGWQAPAHRSILCRARVAGIRRVGYISSFQRGEDT